MAQNVQKRSTHASCWFEMLVALLMENEAGTGLGIRNCREAGSSGPSSWGWGPAGPFKPSRSMHSISVSIGRPPPPPGLRHTQTIDSCTGRTAVTPHHFVVNHTMNNKPRARRLDPWRIQGLSKPQRRPCAPARHLSRPHRARPLLTSLPNDLTKGSRCRRYHGTYLSCKLGSSIGR